jgi:hypothetical protein
MQLLLLLKLLFRLLFSSSLSVSVSFDTLAGNVCVCAVVAY